MGEGEVWVLAEQHRGAPMRASYGLFGKAREVADVLGVPLSAVVLAKSSEKTIEEVSLYAVDKIYVVEDDLLDVYQSELYVEALTYLVRTHSPQIVLAAATSTGMDLAPRLAAKLDTGLTAHCIDLAVEEIEGRHLLIQLVPGWGGNLIAKIVCPRRLPQIATVKSGAFKAPQPRQQPAAEVVREKVDLSGVRVGARVIKFTEPAETTAQLEDSEVIVAVGAGMSALGNLDLARDLSHIVKGSLGGTRPIVDKGWLPEDRMIGISGKTVTPKLLISLGASGAAHFTSGFTGAQVVLAVNQDRNAPIFECCDVGIVGDLRKVLPELVRQLSPEPVS